MVVDDEPDNIRLLGQLLSAQGYQVHVAESGEQALDIMDAMAGAVRIDLVLLDILIPNGMDGVAICRALKGRTDMACTPVIFLTAKDDRSTIVQAFAAGGADYVVKPFDAAVLLARVRTHVRLGQLSRDQEAALAEQTRELMDANDRLRRLASEISLVEEREKRRLAGELHDSPMQKLSLAQIQIGAAARHRDKESDRMLGVGLELLREALSELRTLQFELSPPLLYQEGLGPALRWLLSHTARRVGLELSYAESGTLPRIRTELAVALFQCARELLYNLIKHAGATRGEMELRSTEDILRLTVSDNGRGFKANADGSTAVGGGYGLFAIRERLGLWGGALMIETGAAGTQVTVEVALATSNDETAGHGHGAS